MLEKFLEVLTRIAVACETMAKATQGVNAVTETPKKAIAKKSPVAEVATAPVAAPLVETTPPDMFATGDAPDPEISIESVLAALKMHALKFGNPATLALMKKHGANATTPTIKSIPSANYKTLLAEVKSDIEKLVAKG